MALSGINSSGSHQLYPFEQSGCAYMPVEIVPAAVLATGFRGPISLEVLNASLNQAGQTILAEHSSRGMNSLRILFETAKSIPAI